MLDFNHPEVQFAMNAAAQASKLVYQVQVEMAGASITKDDQSPVTVADFAAQALVARLLLDAFPEDDLVAEESSQVLQSPDGQATLQSVQDYVQRFIPDATESQICTWIDKGSSTPGKRFWVLDPIDGTKGFLRGGQYVVALALVENGLVQLGVLGCPNLDADGREDFSDQGSLFAAQRGRGTWSTVIGKLNAHARLNPIKAFGFERRFVTQYSNPADMRLLRSFEAAHTNTSVMDELVEKCAIQAEPVLLDSQAKYAMLAAGRGEAIVRLLSKEKPDYREKIWDQAAGSLVVEEAGGRISDLDGLPLDFSVGRTLEKNRGVLASNGRLHAALLDCLAEMSL